MVTKHVENLAKWIPDNNRKMTKTIAQIMKVKRDLKFSIL